MGLKKQAEELKLFKVKMKQLLEDLRVAREEAEEGKLNKMQLDQLTEEHNQWSRCVYES